MKNLFLLLFISTLPLYLFAQEKSVPMDESGKLMYIDRNTEKKIKLFTEIPDFKEARIYMLNDSAYSLEIFNTKNERFKKELTNAELKAFRANVSTLVKQYAPNVMLNQEGRTTLLLSTTLTSLWFHGTSFSFALDAIDNPGAVYLLTGSAGFFIPYLLTQNREVTMGEALSSFYLQSRGMLYGMLFPNIFADETDFRVNALSGSAFSIAGGFLGYQLAKNKKPGIEHIETIGTFGDFGMGIGIGSFHALGLLNGDHPGAWATVGTLAGAAGGMILGDYLAKKQYYTSGDLYMLYGAGMLGAYLPFAITAAMEPDDIRWASLTGTLGCVGGLYLGDKLAAKYDFSIRQGLMITLAEMAGGLAGMGAGFLLGGDSYEDISVKTAVIGAGIGALAGFGLMTKTFTKAINQEDKDIALKMSINPMGLLSLSGKNIVGTAPVVMASIRF